MTERKKCPCTAFSHGLNQPIQMMMTHPYTFRQWLALPVFFLFASMLAAQTVENCTNGIDDDGDGLIDCYDQDCTCTGQCDDFYYTTCNADCYYIPPCDQVSLGVQWVGEAETGTYSPLVAGDMDQDGIPEIVTYRVEEADIYIIDGATGATKVHIVGPTKYAGGTAPAMADLDNDGFGEFVLVGNDRVLRCYSHTGALKFESPVLVGYHQRYRFSVPNIADFDHDGLPEINIGNQVFSGQTGALLAEGGPGLSAGEHPKRRAAGFSFNSTVAIDALPDNFCPDCAGLEIVAGNQVLSVNLNTGVVTAVVTADPLFTDGFTSVADFDRDGDLDAIVQGEKGGQNHVYCWEIETPFVMREYHLPTNWHLGASRANIADLNGDGQLEISFVEYPRLIALHNNFSAMWTHSTNDVSSVTCSSVFDFCGDGSADVVYRGETFLQVLEGADGSVKWQDNCLSATHIENPLVLDVDGDGQTEIVIQCGSNGGSTTGNVIAYEAVGTPGIASRSVWNQHAYFNTNINDDLSVPRIQQNPHVIGDSLRMNTFLNQYFNPTFPSPDGALALQNLVCREDSLELTLEVCNTGDNILPLLTPVSLYRGNPQTTPAIWLGAAPLGFDLLPDSCRTFVFNVPRVANDSVFLVLNDDHSIPTPFLLEQDFPSTSIGECSFVNNIAAFFYAYNPASLDIGPADTLVCDNATVSLDASGQDFVSWLWHDGSAAAGYTAPEAGVYAVTVTDVCGITQTAQTVVGIDSSTVVTLGPDRVLCQGETVTLGEAGFDFYTWTSPPGFLNCSDCPNVTAAPSASGLVVLQAGFDNGCWSRDTVALTVNDTFYVVIDTTVCYGRTVVWNNVTISPDETATFPLQTIHGCDSTVLVRVTGTSSGTYQVPEDTAVCQGKTLAYHGFTLEPGDAQLVLLTASTGCDSSVSITVTAKDTFYTTSAPVLCFGETILFDGQQLSISGVYSRQYQAANGCDSTHLLTLTVLPPIDINLQKTPTCLNEQTGLLQASVSGGAGPYAYTWSVPDEQQPMLSDLAAGLYTLTVTDSNNCTETAQGEVPAYPAIQFEVMADSAQCYGEASGSIEVLAADPAYTYSIDGAQYSVTPFFTDLTAGHYTVFVQDVNGCTETTEIAVNQPPQILVQLPADTSIRLGDSLQLYAVFSTADSLLYQWNTTEYLSCADCPDPVARPFSNIWYSLTVTDKQGCSASDDVVISIERILDIFVPNVITLNARDEMNGRLALGVGPSVQRIVSFQVFDRWGALVHEVRNYLPGNASDDWVGEFRGKKVDPGVFIWWLEVELIDGSTQKISGDVTVLR